MVEYVAKIMWALVVGSFGIGAWVATLEWRARSYDDSIAIHEIKISKFNDTYSEDQKKLIDILGRMDERLKVIERNVK